MSKQKTIVSGWVELGGASVRVEGPPVFELHTATTKYAGSGGLSLAQRAEVLGSTLEWRGAPAVRVEVEALAEDLLALEYMGFNNPQFHSASTRRGHHMGADVYVNEVSKSLRTDRLYKALDYLPKALFCRVQASWFVRVDEALCSGDAKHNAILAATAMATIQLYPEFSVNFLRGFNQALKARGLGPREVKP